MYTCIYAHIFPWKGDLNIYWHKNKEDKNKEMPKHDAPLKLYDEHVLFLGPVIVSLYKPSWK